MGFVVPFADARSQIGASEDAVIVAVISGTLYALDRSEGCNKWNHDTGATLRTSMSKGKSRRATTLFVGDKEADVYDQRSLGYAALELEGRPLSKPRPHWNSGATQ